MDEGVLVLDERRVVIVKNRAAEKIIGHRLNPASRTCIDTLLAESNRPFCTLLEDAIASGESFNNREIAYRRRNREARLLVSAFSHTYPPPARTTHMYVLLRDITRLWHLHVKEKQLMAQVRKNYIIQMENLRQIAESVAHEVRNPIASIGGYANLLVRKIDSGNGCAGEYRKYIAYIREDAERLLALVSEVEKYTDNSGVRFSRENVMRVVADSISFAKRFGTRTGVKVEAPQVEPAECLVYIDTARLKAAFRNLVRQAITLSSGTEPVSIHLHVNPFEIVFAIDINTKLPREDVPFLFNPFFSVHERMMNFDLANAQRVLMLHGGMISTHWGGEDRLTFRLSMPREKRLLRI
jgi:nitrogen-specific signal transduction histidine kinase